MRQWKKREQLCAAAVYALLSTTTIVAFQVGPLHHQQHQHQQQHHNRPFRYAPSEDASTWNENLSLTTPRWRDSSRDAATSWASPGWKRRFRFKTFPALISMSLSSSTEKSTNSNAAASESTPALSSELAGTMVRLMAQFLTSELKSKIEEVKRNELVEDVSQQMEKLEATVRETQEAQEKLLPTWKAAEEAVQENINKAINESQESSTSTTLSTTAAATSTVTGHFRGDVNTNRTVTLFDHFDTGVEAALVAELSDKTETSPFEPISSSENVDMSLSVVEKDNSFGVENIKAIDPTESVTEAATTTATDYQPRVAIPRIPAVISMEFGKPLPVIAESAESQKSETPLNSMKMDGLGASSVISPPSMSLSSIRNDDDLSEFSAIEDEYVEDASETVVALENIELLNEQGEDVDASIVNAEEAVVENSSSSIIEEVEEADASTLELPQQLPPLTEEELSAKYASIPSWGDRAFAILLDLGLIQITPDPDDPNYDHSQDDELSPDNIWT